MRAKRIFAVVMTLVMVLGLNVTSAFAAEGVWTIDGLANVTGGDSTNNVGWTNSDSADYGNCWSFWSKNGSSDGAWIDQTVTLEAGTYTLSFIYQGQGENPDSVTFYGYIGDNKGIEDTSGAWVSDGTDQSGWGQYTTDITVDAAGTYEVGVYADVSTAGCWAQIDNISLVNSSGTELLTEGDFDFAEADYAKYIVNNADASSSSDSETTEASSSNSNSATTRAASGSRSTSTTKSSTAAKTGDNTPIAMAAIAIVAASAVVVSRRKKVSE